jgi:hypothetical protein
MALTPGTSAMRATSPESGMMCEQADALGDRHFARPLTAAVLEP